MHRGNFLDYLFTELTAFWTVLARALQRIICTAAPAQRFKHVLLLATSILIHVGNLSLSLDSGQACAMAILFRTRTFRLTCILGFLGALESCRVLLKGRFRSFL